MILAKLECNQCRILDFTMRGAPGAVGSVMLFLEVVVTNGQHAVGAMQVAGINACSGPTQIPTAILPVGGLVALNQVAGSSPLLLSSLLEDLCDTLQDISDNQVMRGRVTSRLPS